MKIIKTMALALAIAVILALDAQATAEFRWTAYGIDPAKCYLFALGQSYGAWNVAFGNGSFNPQTEELESLVDGARFYPWLHNGQQIPIYEGGGGIFVEYFGWGEAWNDNEFLNQWFAVVVVLDSSPDRYGIDIFAGNGFPPGDPEDNTMASTYWKYERYVNHPYYNHTEWYNDNHACYEYLSAPFNPTEFAVASVAQTVTVTFSDNEGGFASTDITQTVGSNYILPSPDPTREGYTFDGWGETVLGVGVPYVTGGTKVEEASAHTLWAHWSPNDYTVTFDWQGAESFLDPTKEVTFGMAFGTLPWPVWSGWWFEGWWTQANGAGTQVSPSTKVTVADDITLYAKWTLTHQVSPPVFVPYWWLEQWTNNIVDYEELALSRGANGMAFWESFVAGCDPTNEVSRFVVTNFVVNAGGGVGAIDWTPNRCDREYRVLGKTNLSDKGWYWPTNDASRFFKVEVRLK